MSDKITIGGKDYTIAELRRVAWRGDCNMHINALLDHIEAQQGERQALVSRLLEMLKSREWLTHHAAENTYCPECNTDSWKDQDEHEPGCAYVQLVRDADGFLQGYPAARPMPTREQVIAAMADAYDYDFGVNKEEAADAIMALFGAGGE